MSSYPAITPDQWPEIARLYHEDGQSLRQLAARFGASRNTLSMVLSASGAPPRNSNEGTRVRCEGLALAREVAAQSPRRSLSLEQRAKEWAALRVAEGMEPEAALSWARQAIGLEEVRQPGGGLRLSPEWRRACRDHAAVSRYEANFPLGEVR